MPFDIIPFELYIVFKAVLLILPAILATVGVTRQFQMMQLNSYFTKRYLGWIKDSKAKVFPSVLFLILAVLGGFFIYRRSEVFQIVYTFAKNDIVLIATLGAGTAVLLAVLFGGYGFAARSLKKNRTSIKPLVVTARVKRMYFAVAVIGLALAACAVVFDSYPGFAFWCALWLCVFVPPVPALIALWILSPIEKAIAKGYVRQAKKILAADKNLTVLGITGSYGKTSTKFIVKRILDESFNVLATPGSFNTPMGVVRTVREHMRPTTNLFVCEMGAKKRGDIKEICDIAHPQIGIITSVGPQHLDTFGSIDAVADTKFELADAANEVFLNFDNEIIRSRAEGYNYTSYGTTPDCDVYAENIQYGSFGASFNVICDGTCIPVITRLLGRHNVLNITAGVAVAKRLGISDSAIEYAASRLTPTEHRLELKSFVCGSLMIDDAYNANPEGCLEAVNVLSSFEGKKKIIVTPGLVELGEREYECNYNLGLAAAEKCDIIILVGKERSIPLKKAAEDKGFPEDRIFVVSQFAEAVEIIKTMADKDTVTLVENDLPDNYLK